MAKGVAFSLVLFLGCIALYAPVRQHAFVNYDDPDYVTANPHVRSGLTVTFSCGLISSVEIGDAAGVPLEQVIEYSFVDETKVGGFLVGTHGRGASCSSCESPWRRLSPVHATSEFRSAPAAPLAIGRRAGP
jgi:hypothetical protein